MCFISVLSIIFNRCQCRVSESQIGQWALVVDLTRRCQGCFFSLSRCRASRPHHQCCVRFTHLRVCSREQSWCTLTTYYSNSSE
ncbi:hypothetical protein F4604DRAFT_1723371 [Suillus subluteus]|nr:hypothetical protein F4604DRAFT_1723371 [Suillus subluteus]